nr:protein C2-DOMAIN ABA-RELATED 4 [Ipomoea trifida]GMD41275.1 protein C2-DOMAIN ABA-RELATED 4-like [Ipomoea batatas]GMD96807.1 protein C2-DOMAIN ABA-RELATED 4-like [Ipomoea batatas]
MQKLNTRFIRKGINPEWNEDLTLSVAHPNASIKLTVDVPDELDGGTGTLHNSAGRSGKDQHQKEETQERK